MGKLEIFHSKSACFQVLNSTSIITAKNCPFSRNHKNDDWSRKWAKTRSEAEAEGLCCIRRKPADPYHPAWHIFVQKAFAAKCAFFSFIKKGFLRSVLKCTAEINLMILKGPAVDVLPLRGTKIISLIILSRNPPLLITVPFWWKVITQNGADMKFVKYFPNLLMRWKCWGAAFLEMVLRKCILLQNFKK